RRRRAISDPASMTAARFTTRANRRSVIAPHRIRAAMHPRRKGTLFIVAAALLWSTGGIGIKAIADSALKVTFYRSLFAALALMLFLRRARWRRTASFAVAVICYAACLTTFVVATKWTTAANAIFLQYAGVVWVL